jgi:hypothetical protein
VNFLWYVATFKQPLHIEYISPICGSYHDFLYKGLLLTRKLVNQGFLWVIYFLFLVFWRHVQHYFSYIMATNFSGGGIQSTRRKPSTMGNQLVTLSLALRVECTHFCKLQSRARTHVVLVIGLYQLLDPTT